MSNVSFPKISQSFYPLAGGLDLVTPAIAIEPGKVIDAQNYEPAIGGGYRRGEGYERFDGKASPTSASYWIQPTNVTGTIVVGNTVTGATSAATGIVLAIITGNIVLGRVTGTFTTNENLTIAAVIVATNTGLIAKDSSPSSSDNADYALLAANDTRTLILVVPGSGRIRGVYVYADVIYAFRDNAGGTAGDMYKATAGGWVKIVFLTELRFTGAVGQINIGDTIVGGTSTATAIVTAALLMSGTWTVSGVGSLILSSVVGTFTNGEAIKVAAVTKVTASANSALITRLPGGTMGFFTYNFTGSTDTKKMYGVDGINTVFEFDGATYIPIRTGMAIDTPTQVIAHKGFLFLGFNASVQYSGLGNPYAWTVVLGSGEIDCSKPVTGFLPQGGTQNGSALAIFTAERTFILYGTSNADFKLVSSIFDIGYSAFTAQQVSNNAFGIGNRGIQALLTTLNYGDFDYESITHMVQPFINKKRGLECSSNSVRSKNQYRVYFTDGTALAVGLTGDKVSSILPMNYVKTVRCITSQTLSTGAEVTYFGSDDGYVYQDHVGTSQDGAAIEAWIRLPFNNNKSPLLRKRFRRAVLEMSVESYAQVNIAYDFGYGNPNVQPSAPVADTMLIGAGGYWDSFTWDQFTWDAQFISNPTIQINGTEKNISFLFYSNRAQDKPHIISGLTLITTPRILQR